jgi:hypothetical protein
MSNGLLMDHSKNTTNMDLTVNLFLFYFPLVFASGMGHMFFILSAWNVIIVEIWGSTPHATLFHM